MSGLRVLLKNQKVSKRRPRGLKKRLNGKNLLPTVIKVIEFLAALVTIIQFIQLAIG